MYEKYFKGYDKFKKFVDKTEMEYSGTGKLMSLDKLFDDYFHRHMSRTDRANLSIQHNAGGGYGLTFTPNAKILPISVYTDKADTGVHSNPTHKQTNTPINNPKQPKTTNNKPVIHTQPTPQTPSPHEPKKPPTNDDLLQKLVDSGLAKVHNKPPQPPPKSNEFTPRVEGELSPKEIYSMPISKRIDYARKMATIFRDKGMGGYRLPPQPPAPEKMYQGKVEVLGSGNMPMNTMKPAQPTPPPPKKTPTVISATPNPKQICIGDCPS